MDVLLRSGCLLADAAGGAANPATRTQITLRRRCVAWEQNFTARVLEGAEMELTFNPAKKPPNRKNRPAPPRGAGGPGALGDAGVGGAGADAGDVEGEGADDAELEAWL
eukprot:3791499-Pyramimonas_sp.AAC.1